MTDYGEWVPRGEPERPRIYAASTGGGQGAGRAPASGWRLLALALAVGAITFAVTVGAGLIALGLIPDGDEGPALKSFGVPSAER